MTICFGQSETDLYLIIFYWFDRLSGDSLGDTQTDRQTYRHTDRQTYRHTDRQTLRIAFHHLTAFQE